jgi:hypothetical protein
MHSINNRAGKPLAQQQTVYDDHACRSTQPQIEITIG